MTKIIAFSGRKQSGKNTCANFIYSTFLAKLNICQKINLNNSGQIEVSDILNKKEYSGVFDPTNYDPNDFIMSQALDKLNPHVKMYSFADPLKKDVCMNVLGLSYDQCYGSDEQKNELVNCKWPDSNLSMTAREVMQYVGTDIFRKMKPDVWTSAIIRKINQENPSIALITDCRFPNEVECIQENNGVVIRLSRNVYDSDHISETILDKQSYDWKKFDYVIDNESIDIYEQSMQVEKILNEVTS